MFIMENTMSQFATSTMSVHEALTTRICQLPTKDVYAIAGVICGTLLAAFIAACVTKSDISIAHGAFEMKHTSIANATIG